MMHATIGAVKQTCEAPGRDPIQARVAGSYVAEHGLR